MKTFEQYQDTKSEQILQILLDFTEKEERYIGGGDGPNIIYFKGSEDKNPKEFLSKISDRIAYIFR